MSLPTHEDIKLLVDKNTKISQRETSLTLVEGSIPNTTNATNRTNILNATNVTNAMNTTNAVNTMNARGRLLTT